VKRGMAPCRLTLSKTVQMTKTAQVLSCLVFVFVAGQTTVVQDGCASNASSSMVWYCTWRNNALAIGVIQSRTSGPCNIQATNHQSPITPLVACSLPPLSQLDEVSNVFKSRLPYRLSMDSRSISLLSIK